MITTIKSLMLLSIMLAVLSAFFALPLWALWPYGARVLGAPALGYLDVFCILLTAGVGYATVYMGGNVVRSGCKVVVATLPD